ncbi:MAG: S1 RNA-binding domain-containing protein [Acidobacteria bacterium]|nr:S1 RNA-binding domain-containing protein [Acidobacteriota bacterium]
MKENQPFPENHPEHETPETDIVPEESEQAERETAEAQQEKEASASPVPTETPVEETMEADTVPADEPAETQGEGEPPPEPAVSPEPVTTAAEFEAPVVRFAESEPEPMAETPPPSEPEAAAEVAVDDDKGALEAKAEPSAVAAGEASPSEDMAEETLSPAMEKLTADQDAAPTEFEKMMEAYEQKIADVRKGSFVEGKIVKIQEDNVLVDIGTRCEGIFPVDEIKDKNGNLKYSEGDPIIVQVLSSAITDFSIRLSHKNARNYELLEELRKSYQEGTPVEGTIVEAIKGGMRVDIHGLEAFLPASQVEPRYVENLEQYVGLADRFRIVKFNIRQKKIVVSRRAVMEDEMEERKAELWNTLQLGDKVKGKVSRLTGYGVFVDLGGVDGLIHISNLSWDKVKKPSELVRVGQEIETQIIELDRERERIGLGLKQMVEDPWLTVSDRYFVDQRVTGVVEKLESFGAFVKLEPGITALIPISEMSWIKRINHPSEVLSKGDQVEAMVLRVDQNERKISLSLKQVTPSPFQHFVDQHQIGEILDGEVTNVVGYGAFVKLDEGVEGLLHISELSWLPVRNIDEFVKAGEKIQVKIIGVNREDERISLSAKLSEPPEDEQDNVKSDTRGVRDDRRPPRKGARKDKGEDQHYILKKVPSSSTKLGEMFPQDLLDKMKSKK